MCEIASVSSSTSITAQIHQELNYTAFLRILESWAKPWIVKDFFMMQMRLGRFVSKGKAAWEQVSVLDGLGRAFLCISALPCPKGGGAGA